jgi:sigma-B regulation protein RsbU (phosphoserine phosphatase)
MSLQVEPLDNLVALNRIVESLNQAVDVHGGLEQALADLVELMGLQSAWITLQDVPDPGHSATGDWVLAAHHHLPPALAPGSDAWSGSCRCRELCTGGRLTGAYNEVHCSRLDEAQGDRRGLAVHASAPLRSADRTLGILNVAAADWSEFSPEALSLLTNVGHQMGIALERAQLFDLLQQRQVNQQAALLDFSQQLLGHLDLDDMIAHLVEEVRKILYADASAVLLAIDEQDGDGVDLLEFRASAGWRLDPGAQRRRVPASVHSGHGLVLSDREPLAVENVQEHDMPAWAPNWVQEEGFRGHAAVPLMVNSHSVGVLVVNQREPRLLKEDDMHCLQLMANQAALAIEKARLHEEEVKARAMERELEVGREIQLSMLPASTPVLPGWEFASYYQAAREVGGDFFDFFELPDAPGRLGMVIADVTGKGVPAALFMARTSKVMQIIGMQSGSPLETLRQTNESMMRERGTHLLLSALYAVLDIHSGRLVYANAGHCWPLWLQSATGQVVELDARGVILGALTDTYLEERELDVQPGDLLLFYSDGLTEAMNATRQLFGEERLAEVLAANQGSNAQEMLEAIVDAVRDFCGDTPQSDDLTLFVVRRSGPGERHVSG